MNTMSKTVFRRLALAVVYVAASIVLPANAETVSIYTYHNHPPFIVGTEKGLTYDFVDFLNRKANGNPAFQVVVVPRARLDKIVATPSFNGAVAWVNPAWFKDKDRIHYLWSDRVLDDANVILSNVSDKIDYKTPLSLKGKRFGGVLGHSYAGIDELVAAGVLKREDANTERSNVLKLAAERIDATLLPRSTAHYLLHELGLTQKIYIAPNVHSSFSRHVLISKNNPALHRFVNEAVGEMTRNDAWLATLARYKSN